MLSTPSDGEVLEFPVTGGGNAPEGTTEKKVIDLKIEFDARVEPENPRVNDEAVVLALKYPGDLTVDQIASIYSYLKNGDDSKKGWGYVRDPRGIDYLRYANASLKLGDRANCVGGGDCDDFAILMSALVESIGGTTRIILARNNSTGGHAYTEVYLGRLNDTNNQVDEIINWLKQKFNTNKIYTHIDTDTKDVWLNLDWGADETGNAHPGGPFYHGDKHIVLCIRDKLGKTTLKAPIVSSHTPSFATQNVSIAALNGTPQFQPTAVHTFDMNAVMPGQQLTAAQLQEYGGLNPDPIGYCVGSGEAIYVLDFNGMAFRPVSETIYEMVQSIDLIASATEKADLAEASVQEAFPALPQANATQTEIVLAENQSPILNSLTSDKASPLTPGISITWSANATDEDKDPVLYRFFLNGPATGGAWQPETEWGTANTWTWTTSSEDAGENQVMVWARDGKHAAEDSYDSELYTLIEPVRNISNEVLFSMLSPNLPPKLTALLPDKPSPQFAETIVRWTASAADPEGEPVLYKFWLKGPSTGNNWAMVQDWSVRNQWTMANVPPNSGAYIVYVYARDGKHSLSGGYDSTIGQNFTLI